MSDLISRKALLEEFQKTITESSDTFDWINLINNQPTAYDVDKVVEQLESLHQDGLPMRSAIRFVKKGGLEE